jgi:predicted acyltransferase (DUF342 family)
MSQIYGIINITEFLKASSLTNYVYQQVTLSDWNVNSLISSKFVGIGLQGTITDENFSFDDYGYILHVNGSSYFQDFCKFNDNIYVENDININNNLNVNGNTQINTLSVNNLSIYESATINNMSVFNLDVSNSLNINCEASFYNNVSILGNTTVNNNLLVNKNVNIDNSLNVLGNVNISVNLNVKNNISTHTLYVNGSSIFNNNISAPFIETKNASIYNLSSNNITTYYINTYNDSTIGNNLKVTNNITTNSLTVNNNASINNNLYVANYANIENVSVKNNAELHNLNVVTNTTTNNINILTKATINNLEVNGTTTTKNTTMNGTLNYNNMYLGPSLSQNQGTYSNIIYFGPNKTEFNKKNHNVFVDIDGNAHIGILYADTIICSDIDTSTSGTSVRLNTNITEFSVINTTDLVNNQSRQIYGLSKLGTNIEDNIEIRHFTYGVFEHGIGNPKLQGTSTYFDLSANNQYTGITYNGPINIGQNISNTFNLNASGTINYDGLINIGQKNLSTLFNLNGNGTINYDGSFNVGQTDINTKINLNGNGIINYDGLFNIGQTNLNTEFNLNGNGVINFNGNTTLSGTFDISASSLTDGIQYDGPISINSYDAHLDLDGMINLYGALYITKSNNNIPVISADGDIDIEGNIMVTGNIKLTNDITIGGNIYSKSDIKIKNNITKLNNCLEKIDNIHGYSYTRNDLIDTEKLHIGLIAQEVESIYPEIISEINNVKTINYNSINAILLECVKELKLELIEMKKELTQLKLK